MLTWHTKHPPALPGPAPPRLQHGAARRTDAFAFLDVFSYLSTQSRRVVAQALLPQRVTFDAGRRTYTEEAQVGQLGGAAWVVSVQPGVVVGQGVQLVLPRSQGVVVGVGDVSSLAHFKLLLQAIASLQPTRCCPGAVAFWPAGG